MATKKTAKKKTAQTAPWTPDSEQEAPASETVSNDEQEQETPASNEPHRLLSFAEVKREQAKLKRPLIISSNKRKR